MSVSSLLRRRADEPARLAFLEMGAYEALWERPGASFKTVSAWIAGTSSGRAAELVSASAAQAAAREIKARLTKADLADVGLRLHGTPDYPEKLCDARYPLRAFYYRGNWELVSTRS